MKPEKQLSGIFINYMSLFQLSNVPSVFFFLSCSLLSKLINKHTPFFSPCELAVASTHRGLKAPSETCDVWRGDILAGIQLIVHQSGRAAVMLFNWLYSRRMTTATMSFKTSETTSRHHVGCIWNGNQVLLRVLPIPFVLQRLACTHECV